jgi:hypothetical protein
VLFRSLKGAEAWQRDVVTGLRQVAQNGLTPTRPGELGRTTSPGSGMAPLALVDDDTIEREILTSRLALAIMDKASWEFTDLRSRVAGLEERAELDPHDLLRAHVLSRVAVDAWRNAGLRLDGWRDLQGALHDEFAGLVEEAYHEVNHWLVGQGVMPEIDLRPYIRRSRSAVVMPAGGGSTEGGDFRGGGGAGGGGAGSAGGQSGMGHSAFGTTTRASGGPMGGDAYRRVADETRLMTRSHGLARSGEHAEAVLGRLNRLVARHLPGFGKTSSRQSLSPGLAAAIDVAQDSIRQRASRHTSHGDVLVTTPALLADLHQRKQQLKALAGSPEERATIEIVALLFQSILTEDRIPPAVRVWFARLQMPVLRVAVSEPDFFEIGRAHV